MDPDLAALSGRRALRPWYLIEFANSYAMTLLTYCAYFYAQRALGASPGERLWLSAGWGTVALGSALIAGQLAQRFGPRRVIGAATGTNIPAALAGLIALHWPSMWTLFAAMAIFNLSCNQLWPSLESAITRSPGRMALPARLTLFNVTWAAASFAALASADAVIELGWTAIFVVPAAVSALGWIVAAGFAIPAHHIAAHQPATPSEDPAERARAARAGTLLLMAWIANALSYMAINVLIPAMPTLTRNSAGSSASAGSLWGFARFAGFILFWLWGAWHYRVRYMLLFHALLAASFCCLLVFPYSVMDFYGGQVVFGLGISFIYASSLYYALHTSSGSAKHAAMHEALIGAGIAIGPAIGALAGVAGDRLPPIGLTVATVLVIGGIVLAVLGRRAARQGRAHHAATVAALAAP